VSGKPARFLRNTLIETLSSEEPLPFPAQLRLTAPLAETGDAQSMALYAGQSAALTVEKPAGELVQQLAEDADMCFKKFTIQSAV
jgi:nitronate monooxygenase